MFDNSVKHVTLGTVVVIQMNYQFPEIRHIDDVRDAIANNMDIVWDRTNLTAKSRASKLSQIPDNYNKVAVFFSTPPDIELKRRLDSRPGKTIPANIVLGMKSQLETPTTSEGFDKVISV